MAISFSCAKCGKAYQVDERFAGRNAACRACGTINAIPAEEGASPVAPVIMPASPPAPAMTSLQTAPVRVAPAPSSDDTDLPLKAAPEEEAHEQTDHAARLAAAQEDLELTDEPPIAPEPPKRVVKVQRALPVEGCPNCGGALADGASICTACGFNLKTGKKISTAVVNKEAPEAKEEPVESDDDRHASRSLRLTALALIIVGLLVSTLPFFSLPSLAMTAPLLGAAMAMIGAAIYFIDGAWEWGLAGVAAMMVSIVIMLTGAGTSSTPAPPLANANLPITPTPAPATTQSADPGPKVSEIEPGKYSVRAPGKTDDPVEYWRPVLLDKDPKIRAIALQRLAKLPDQFRPEATDAIAQNIMDDDREIRRAVMKQLSQAKTTKTIAAAIVALDDKDHEIADQALALLSQWKDESAILPIAKKYAVLGKPVFATLAGYDAASKEKVQAAYKTILDSADAQTRAKILDALSQTDPTAAADILIANLADSDAETRHIAMARLSEMKYLPGIDPIAQKLKDDADLAAKALLRDGPPAEKSVAAKLADTDSATRFAAINVLKEIATEQSLESIKQAAKDPDFALAMAARQVWRKIDSTAFPPIEEALVDLDAGKEFQTRALNSLKTLPVDEHQKTIARKLFDLAMGDGDAAIKSAAYDALLLWADQSVKDLLVLAIKPDTDDAKRATAIRLAAHFKDRRAIKPICLCLIEGKNLAEVIPALHEFDNAPEEFLIPLIGKSTDAAIQTTCFDLLRDIGTRRCFTALNAIATNKTADEQLKKRAKETMIEITRRLNTAAARKPPPASRPATQPVAG